MNWYWLIAGILMIIGGIMHTVIGERNVIRKLKEQKDQGGFPTDEAFNLIRWFWYLGSFISFWIGVLAILIGYTDGILEAEQTIGKLLASIMFGFAILTFGIVALLNPKDLQKLGQVVILILVMVLLWIGSICCKSKIMVEQKSFSPIQKLKAQVACPVELALRVLGGKMERLYSLSIKGWSFAIQCTEIPCTGCRGGLWE